MLLSSASALIVTDVNWGWSRAGGVARSEAVDEDQTAGRELRRRAVVFGFLDFLSPWATIGFPLLSGAVLIEKDFASPTRCSSSALRCSARRSGCCCAIDADRSPRPADRA